MKIGVLTSSRADYGIYSSLLNELKNDDFFDLSIIAFGTHLSKNHGYTLNDIKKDNYNEIHTIKCINDDDSERGISISYSTTIKKFAEFWSRNNYDLVFCLGDRFEMSAAVQSSIPFGIKLAHIHGGETTLGAIDNIYRHQITLASKYHFVTNKINLRRVKQINGNLTGVYNVGSLSISDIKKFKPFNRKLFFKKFKINDAPYILATFHPETISVQNNLVYAKIIKNTLLDLSKNINIIITMPNADTLGSVYRKELKNLKNKNPNNILLIENFGKINYFNAIHFSSILIGNTSSGIIEAASFNKYVINVGDRQKGRSHGENVFNTNYDKKNIIEIFKKLNNKRPVKIENIYFKKNTAKRIVKIIKKNERIRQI